MLKEESTLEEEAKHDGTMDLGYDTVAPPKQLDGLGWGVKMLRS
jgi:hypothetical protein